MNESMNECESRKVYCRIRQPLVTLVKNHCHEGTELLHSVSTSFDVRVNSYVAKRQLSTQMQDLVLNSGLDAPACAAHFAKR